MATTHVPNSLKEPAANDRAANLVYAVEDWETFEPDMLKVIYDHWREVAIDQATVPLKMDTVRYRQLEAVGMLHIVTVRRHPQLIGYFTAVVSPHLHYATTMHAMTDLYYLSPLWRRGTIALKLFGTAHRTLKERGVVKIASGTKLHGGLDMTRLLEYMDYRLTEKLFTKLL